MAGGREPLNFLSIRVGGAWVGCLPVESREWMVVESAKESAAAESQRSERGSDRVDWWTIYMARVWPLGLGHVGAGWAD